MNLDLAMDQFDDPVHGNASMLHVDYSSHFLPDRDEVVSAASMTRRRPRAPQFGSGIVVSTSHGVVVSAGSATVAGQHLDDPTGNLGVILDMIPPFNLDGFEPRFLIMPKRD